MTVFPGRLLACQDLVNIQYRKNKGVFVKSMETKSHDKSKVINFEDIGSIAFSKPIFFSYLGNMREESSWAGLYVDVCKVLLNDYPCVFERLKHESIYGTKKKWLADEEHLNQLTVPKKIDDDFYVETNSSAANIVKNMKCLFDECGVDYKNIVIRYVIKVRKKRRIASKKVIYSSKKAYCSKDTGAIGRNLFDTCSNEQREDISLILTECFKKGFRLGSLIETKRLRKFYEIINGKELKLEQEVIEATIKNLGIEYGGRVYMPQNMMSDEMAEKILSFIEECFKDRSAVYYTAVFQEFSVELLDSNIVNAGMLKAFLAYYFSNRYYIGKNFLTKEYRASINPVDEVKECLVQYDAPVQIDTLCGMLSHLEENHVRNILASNWEFVRNSKGEYFHVDSFDLTEEELENIANIIEAAIDEHEFISGNELYDAIKTKYHTIFEKNANFSVIGWRDALKYKMDKRFSFEGNIISKPGTSLSMSDVFAKFGKRKTRFSLYEIDQFATNIGTTIYFDALYSNAVRISHEEFVSKENVHFSVDATDAVLERLCKGKYIPLGSISDYAAFPEASFRWTEYLLEQYVAFYSKKFCLLHGNYNKDCTVGAIVRKSCGYNSFDDLIVDILACHDGLFQKEKALDYLTRNGYIARRSYKNIEELIILARAKNNKKEK